MSEVTPTKSIGEEVVVFSLLRMIDDKKRLIYTWKEK
jgi:hypothetical protein